MSKRRATGGFPRFWPGAPFGRIGAALGFRWIMPIGTMPLPFYPFVAAALPFAVVGLVLWGAADAATTGVGDLSWPGLLFAAALLGVPMSIPIINWLAGAFRVPLLQGLLIAGAAVLAATEAVQGRGWPWSIVLPAILAGLYLVQRIGGPIYLRRLQTGNAAFEPIDAGDRPVMVVERERYATGRTGHIFATGGVARVQQHARGQSSGSVRHRLTPHDAAAIAARLKLIGLNGWSTGQDYVEVPVGLVPTLPPITIRVSRHRAPLWLLDGERVEVTVDDGKRVQRLVGGEAAVVGGWPLFTAFYWMAIFGGRSRWFLGFARDKPLRLDPARAWDLLAHAFPPRAAPPVVDAAPFHRLLDAIDADQRAAAEDVLAALLHADAPVADKWALYRRSDIAAGHGRALCDRLARARDEKDAATVELCAALLASLPAGEWRALSSVLIKLLNSKLLAFRVLDRDVPGVLDLPERERRQHVIGGFRLVRLRPRLYERLGELGEPARWLVMVLGELGGWPDPLKRALAKLDAAPD